MNKTVIIFGIFVLIVSGCGQAPKTNQNRKFERTNSIDREEQNHLFLNLILHRWEELSNTNLQKPDSGIIEIEKIVLIKYKCDFDTTHYVQRGFLFPISPYGLSDFKYVTMDKDSIIKQLQSADKTWNEKFVHSTLKMDSCLTENDISFRHGERYNDNNSFLVVSEPIEFRKDAFWILARLYTQKYNLNTMYIVENENEKWNIVYAVVAIIRIKVDDMKTYENSEGIVVDEINQYAIFEGYIELEKNEEEKID